MKDFVGNAADIGADLFIELIMPMIQEASQQLPPNELVKLYSGLVGAAFGSMEADFGKGTANMIVQKMAQGFIESNPLGVVQ